MEKRSEEGKKKKNLYSSKYSKENYDQLATTIPLGMKEKFKNLASSQGLSISQLLVEAVKEYAAARGLEL